MNTFRLAARVAFLTALILLFCLSPALAQLTGPQEQVDPPWDSIFGTDPINDDEGEGGDGNEGFGFGKKVSGTWIGMGSFDLDFDCDGVADAFPGIPALDVQTIGVGGSYLVTNPSNPNTTQGTWTQTGPRQLTSVAIGFGSNPNCTDQDGDGICESFGPMVSIFSIKTILDFDHDYQNAMTSFAATVHPPTEDPLDPDAVVTICTVGSHASFRKVNAP